MNQVVTCRYCEQDFVLQPGKRGYLDECPICLNERLQPARPKQSKLERHLAASGLTAEQVAKKADRLRKAVRKAFRTLVSEDSIESVSEDFIERALENTANDRMSDDL